MWETLDLKRFVVQAQRFSGGAIGTFLLQIVQLPFSFVTTIFLARWLGTDTLGVYTYSITWLGFLVVFVTLGLDKLLLRYVAVYDSQQAWGSLRVLGKWANKYVWVVSLLVGGGAGLLLFYLPISAMSKTAVLLALVALPFWASIQLKQATLIGLRLVLPAQLPEMLFRPLAFFLLLLLAKAMWASATIFTVVGLQTITIVLTWILLLGLLHRMVPGATEATSPLPDAKLWVASAAPLYLTNLLGVLNSRLDVLLLGTLLDGKAVAIYHIAKRLTQPISFILIAANAPLAARISSLHAQGKSVELQDLLKRTTRYMFAVALPLTLLLVLLRRPLLNLWGVEFVAGEGALIWLALGQLINVFMGSVALVLMMTGHERDVVWGFGGAVIVNVVLNWLLIPYFGANGTAVATSVGLVVSNVILALLVYKRTALVTLP